MDRFDLNWPKTDAAFYTDGWRCRIVWRQKSGIGGTIDNNAQCIRRLALSLDGAPYLLGALKARGHDRLAAEIESAAELEATAAPRTTPAPNGSVAKEAGESEKASKEAAEPPRRAPKEPAVAAKREGAAPLDRWLEVLEGSGEFEAAANRRAKAWFELGSVGDETLFLKTPAAKGKQEWVLKRTWPSGDRKAEYLAAPAFKGVAAYLIGRGDASVPFVEGALAALKGCNHPEVADAAKRWRDVMEVPTH
jgi:hypothetical protein